MDPQSAFSSKSKRPRSSLACIRCRKKKVKCDFMQPSCGRCDGAGLPCSYATPPKRVDGRAFDQIGYNVDDLKERMQRMQSDLVMMKSNLRPFSDDNLGGPTIHKHPAHSSGTVPDPQQQQLTAPNQQPVTWKLSLSPSGLRIDTNIASVAELYRILLNGISQLNISGDSPANLFSMDALREATAPKSPSPSSASMQHASRSRPGLLPAAGDVDDEMTQDEHTNPGQRVSGSHPKSSSRMWEVDESEARWIMKEHYPSLKPPGRDDTTTMMEDQEALNHLVCHTYHNCFLSYQIADVPAFVQCYSNPQHSDYDPLLANSIYAWTSKHACIYHGSCPDKNPAVMGETYFKHARQLLKKRFDISNHNTIHALINLYMYQLACERSSLAYLYIGLAIRMAQDLKFHKKEFMPADPVQREANKRLWWSAYWLDLCAALDSNRPTMVDDKDCDLEYPTRLPCEDDEAGYRIAFTVHSIKLMKVRKDIAKYLPSEQSGQSLLSAISRFENALTTWLQELPMDLRFFDEATEPFQPTGSFRDVAILLLHIHYQTTWIMLHKFFLPKKDHTATPVALLSLNICTKAANLITRMLSLYSQHLPMCQFADTLDGIFASVSIHQVNAIATEDQVAKIVAQRNLIHTSTLLRRSHLVYMDKVLAILDSIDAFLKKHRLPTDLKDLPVVDEHAINEHSISTVFHPSPTLPPAAQPSASPFSSSSSSSSQFPTTPASRSSHRRVSTSPLSPINLTMPSSSAVPKPASASSSSTFLSQPSTSQEPGYLPVSSAPAFFSASPASPATSSFGASLTSSAWANPSILSTLASASSLESVLTDPTTAALFNLTADSLTTNMDQASQPTFVFGSDAALQPQHQQHVQQHIQEHQPASAAELFASLVNAAGNDFGHATPPLANQLDPMTSSSLQSMFGASCPTTDMTFDLDLDLEPAATSHPTTASAPSALQQMFGLSSLLPDGLHQPPPPSSSMSTSVAGGLASHPDSGGPSDRQQQQIMDMLEFITTGQKRFHRDWDAGT
ncbi:hypothetical protein DM01DRAFT_1304334 [Hesseltinella vesiculosa]|uniref:Zn(2)-C6 fungal-type domain-containing protein n=1 Tax=Hesseltinella vesiculosa TaxID=101127 RepID=A0A1X2GKA0_9FUNG|nr:hypothetical protein DM01DRAFT_1304334 [Hesseltinella vesiculosa]